jgi:hypothetical protein
MNSVLPGVRTLGSKEPPSKNALATEHLKNTATMTLEHHAEHLAEHLQNGPSVPRFPSLFREGNARGRGGFGDDVPWRC